MPYKRTLADERLAEGSAAWRNDGGVVRRSPIKEGVNMFLAVR